jgi:Ca2+-binding RTX toxin-like protein
MASIPGGQFTFSAAHQPVNLVVAASGASLPPPIPGDFNLEVITSPIGTSYPLPPGYQGVALLSQGGHELDMLRGSYSVAVTGSGADTVQGGTGNDTIIGGTGAELIYGGHGNDLIIGGTGPDTIYGGAGNDTITGGTGPELIHGGPGNDLISGGTGPDTIYGGAGNDTIHGGTGPELIHGGPGNDLISGGTGPDTIYGGAGNDTIHGGTGPDTIAAGPGHNDIYTGTGPDLVQDTGPVGHDTVFGFGHNDHISFVGEDPNSIQHVVATAQEHNGNMTVTLPDGSSITLMGITHINGGFFH